MKVKFPNLQKKIITVRLKCCLAELPFVQNASFAGRNVKILRREGKVKKNQNILLPVKGREKLQGKVALEIGYGVGAWNMYKFSSICPGSSKI